MRGNKLRRCKCGCGASIEHKHSNARFVNHKHKDRYWNMENPRGKFAHLKDSMDDCDPADDAYWGNKDCE